MRLAFVRIKQNPFAALASRGVCSDAFRVHNVEFGEPSAGAPIGHSRSEDKE